MRSIKEFTKEEVDLLYKDEAKCLQYGEVAGSPLSTRLWLESINSVLNHGVCVGCAAQELCQKFSGVKVSV